MSSRTGTGSGCTGIALAGERERLDRDVQVEAAALAGGEAKPAEIECVGAQRHDIAGVELHRAEPRSLIERVALVSLLRLRRCVRRPARRRLPARSRRRRHARVACGFARVLNLTEDEEYRPGDRRGRRARARGGRDRGASPAPDRLRRPARPTMLEAAVQEVNAWLDEGARTYVHCRAGWQRSAAVAAGVVAVRDRDRHRRGARPVQQRKPSADPLPHQREDLRRGGRRRRGTARPARAH